MLFAWYIDASIGSDGRQIQEQGSIATMNTKGQTQKQQQAIVAKFRAGDCNVLVATCIAEEGIVSITEKKM